MPQQGENLSLDGLHPLLDGMVFEPADDEFPLHRFSDAQRARFLDQECAAHSEKPDDSDLLRSLPLFARMNSQQRAAVYALMDRCTFRCDQVISNNTGSDNHFHIITDGTVEFIGTDGNGKEIVLGHASTGGFFGEQALLSDRHSSVRVRAKDDVKTLALDKTEFLDFVRAHPEAAVQVMSELAHQVGTYDELIRGQASRNVNLVHDESLSFGARVADKIAETIGSWRFILTQTALLAAWVGVNIFVPALRWDPYPFILLNLALSFQAGYSGPIIMMSQNRQAGKDRLSAEIDHQVHLKNEVTLDRVLNRLDTIEERFDQRVMQGL